MKALSETQAAVVAHLKQRPGKSLSRLPGGIWTTADCVPAKGVPFPPRGCWWDVRTVRSLIKKGVLANALAGPEYNGQFILTPAFA